MKHWFMLLFILSVFVVVLASILLSPLHRTQHAIPGASFVIKAVPGIILNVSNCFLVGFFLRLPTGTTYVNNLQMGNLQISDFQLEFLAVLAVHV